MEEGQVAGLRFDTENGSEELRGTVVLTAGGARWAFAAAGAAGGPAGGPGLRRCPTAGNWVHLVMGIVTNLYHNYGSYNEVTIVVVTCLLLVSLVSIVVGTIYKWLNSPELRLPLAGMIIQVPFSKPWTEYPIQVHLVFQLQNGHGCAKGGDHSYLMVNWWVIINFCG